MIPLALSLIPAAGKLAYSLFNKPKKRDYKNEHTTNAMERMISNNQADIVNKTLLNQTTGSAKSLGARMYQQARHGIDIAGNKGLLSEGQQSRAMLSAATDIQSQVGQQQMQAQMANAQHTLALSDRIDYARLSLAQMKDEANAAYKADKSAWGADVAGSVLDIAGAAVNNVINKMADKQMKLDFDALLGGKNPTEMSISELFGFSTAAMMMQYGWKPKAKSSYDDVALSLNAMTDEEKDAVLEDFKIKQWMLTNAGSTK